jgi:hypothetical protein
MWMPPKFEPAQGLATRIQQELVSSLGLHLFHTLGSFAAKGVVSEKTSC